MYLGLDLGTSNVKAVVTDAAGAVLGRASSPVETYSTDDGGTEQDLDQIWSTTVDVLQQIASPDIQAIGISSQAGAMQVLDADGHRFGRVISWLDARGRAFDESITERLGRDWFEEHIGHPGSALTIGQLLRLKQQGRLPDNFTLGFAGDQIVRRLCQCAAHDATSLSLAMLYNPSTKQADAQLLTELGLSEQRLPELKPAREAAGGLTDDVAHTTGLPANIPVSPAIHDQYTAACCAGVIEPGDVMVGTGTAWVLLAVSDTLPSPATDDAWVCTHVAPDRYGQIISLRTGGAAIAQTAEALGLGDLTREQIDRLVSEDTDAGRSLRATIEDLAERLARFLDQLPAASRLVLTGSASAGSVTPQIIADATGLPVQCVTEPDSSALGAAIIARAMTEPETPLDALAREMAPASRPVIPSD